MPSRVLVAAVALTAGLLATTVTVVPRADAAQSTTGSCVDGAGRTWRTKVVWAGVYTATDGVRRMRIASAAWTTSAGGVSTDSVVSTYDGSGTLGQTRGAAGLKTNPKAPAWG